MIADRAYEHTRFLAETCGPRPAGGQAMQKAADYVAEQLRAMGAEVEEYVSPAPISSLASSSLTVTIDGEPAEIAHSPVVFAAATPPEGLRVALVNGGDGSRRYLDEAQPKGKALLIVRDSFMTYPDNVLLEKLHEYEPACVLFTSTRLHVAEPPTVYWNYLATNAKPAPPSAVIGFEDSVRIARAESVEVQYQADCSRGETTCRSIIGTLPGTDPEAGAVMLTAHVDSVYTSPGASDDAAGVGMILALAEERARAHREGKTDRRAIIVAAFSSHEPGTFGSRAYVVDHPDVLDSLRAILVFDVVGDALGGEGLAVTGDATFHGEVARIQAECGFDNWPCLVGPSPVDAMNFYHAEIPTVGYSQGTTPLAFRPHSPADSFDTMSQRAFVSPGVFSQAFLDWALNVDEIERGYPAELAQICRDYVTMFGWGLYPESSADSDTKVAEA